MYFLTAADVVTVLRATGAPAEIHDFGLLAAAVARPRASAFGQDAYPDPWEKAAALLHSLTANHPFVDGNKRAGWNAAWTFLEVDEVGRLDAEFSVDEAEKLVLQVADGTLSDVSEIAAGLRRFAEQR